MDSQPLARLIDRARAQSDAFADQLQAAVRLEVPGYQPGGTRSPADLREGIAVYLGQLFDHLDHELVEDDDHLDARIRQILDGGIPLTSLLHAYRVAAPIIWNGLYGLAQGDSTQTGALIAATPAIFAILDNYSLRTHAIYREVEIRDARRIEQVRTAMLDTILSGHLAGVDFRSAVETLDIPLTGRFVVLVAMNAGDADRDTPPDIEAVVTAHPSVRNAWFRLAPHAQVGLVSLDDGHTVDLDDLSSRITAVTPVHLGISAAFTAISDCTRARAQAQTAVGAAWAGQPGVRYDRDVLLVLMASSPEAAHSLLTATLGQLLDLPAERRDPLVTTMRTWLEHNQSVAATATELHCHRNTINYRLRRFAELAGGSLSDTDWLTQVVLAVRRPLE